MADPVISFYKSNDTDVLDDTESVSEFLPEPDDDIGVALNEEDFGSARAGDSTTEHEIHIWNNKGGVSDVTPAYDLEITSVTLRHANSGGELQEGKEIVEMLMAQVKDLDEDDEYEAVGGMITKALGDLRGDKLSTPNMPTGVVGHESGGEVLPGTYYAKVSALDETGETVASAESVAVPLTALTEQTTEDGNSESLSSGGNTKLTYKVPGVGTYVNGFQLKQTSGGSLVVNVRLEEDNSGEPSGTLVSANSEKLNVTLGDGVVTSVFFNNEITWVDSTIYWLVVSVVSGTGTLKGKATGSTYRVKYYDGTWHDSSNIYDLYCVVIGDNKIDWSWEEVEYALTYKLFRTESSGTYNTPALIAEGIEDITYEDKLCEPTPGEPLAVGTVTYEHCKAINIKIVANSEAQTSDCYFDFEARYNKT
ncbi:MAG: hypothetical protein QHH15_00530 [Candidatus Thermoplasmatota archaeon]|nr:hypothetical protein [Candidatus Thermoplasmatota archaeon]MDH7506260.1 hypothetical protein [Candidatus Thermoplasmatota archaeon]